MNIPVFDFHCDTSLALLGRDGKTVDSLRSNQLHIDLERASQLSGYAQCFACFTTPAMEKWYQVSPVTIFEKELAVILHQIEKNGDMISLAYTPEQIERNRSAGKMSAILTIEGPAGFGYDPELLEDLYQIGFRVTTLGWNESNPLAGSHVTGEGLSDLGRQFVRRAQELGMLIDVSHVSDRAFWDILDITQAPVIASHSNSRAVHPVSRNLTDDMFRAICRTDGVAGINLYSDFLGENATLDTVCDHIFHYLSLDPAGTHISLGGDLDGCDRLPTGFEGVQSYIALAERLNQRGLSEEMIRNIFWNNAIGVMTRAVHNHKK